MSERVVNLKDPIIENLIDSLAARVEKNVAVGGDCYYDDKGLLCCPVCGENKQCVITLGNRTRIVPSCCRCDRERLEREKQELEQAMELANIRTRKENCFGHPAQWRHTFENDDGRHGKMDIIREYCRRWNDPEFDRPGLILTGDVGTGKSYAAECIANYLCEHKTRAVMLNLSEALNNISSAKDRQQNIRELTEYPMLIIDDFGIERYSDYALENIFNLIDNRCRSEKPLIVTTNLSYDQFMACAGGIERRICDRIIGMCVPVSFSGSSGRLAIGAARTESFRSGLSGAVQIAPAVAYD